MISKEQVLRKTTFINSQKHLNRTKKYQKRSKVDNEYDTSYQLFFENMPTCCFILNNTATIITSNKFCFEVLGYTEQEFSNTSYTELLHAEDVKPFQDTIHTLSYTSDSKVMKEFRMATKSGAYIWSRQTIRRMREKDGQDMFLVVCDDITKDKEAQLMLSRQAKELSRTNEDLNQFATAASHDLRQPMRVIMGALQLIERRYQEHFSSEDKDLLKMGQDSILKMNDRIKDLHEYASIMPQPEERKIVNLDTVVDYIVLGMKDEVRAMKAMISSELPELRFELSHAIILFRHLIENALKFRSEEQPFIHLSYQAVEGGYEFAVSDNGIGIEEAYFEQIFGIFKRLHPNEVIQGTGIGLATCKKIVEIHDGRIWVESDFGKGSTFKFFLPKNIVIE